MNNEKIIKDVLASYSRSQTGDVSKALQEQGFFDEGIVPKGLERDPQLSGGNPVDTLKDFNRQQRIKGD